MRPSWAQRGAENVLSARGKDAADILKKHAESLGLKIIETTTVLKDSAEVMFARCEPANPTSRP